MLFFKEPYLQINILQEGQIEMQEQYPGTLTGIKEIETELADQEVSH